MLKFHKNERPIKGKALLEKKKIPRKKKQDLRFFSQI